MALTWFRYHADALNNKRVQKLDPKLFKLWINIQCVLTMEDVGSSGKIPPPDMCAYYLRLSVEETVNNLEMLVQEGLILKRLVKQNETKMKQKTEENETLFNEEKFDYFLKNWGKKQFKSDTSTDRVKRFRERSKTVSGNVLDQTQTQNRTDHRKMDPFSMEKEDEEKKLKPPKIYKIDLFLKDEDREKFRRDFQGWDLHALMIKFDSFIVEKAKERPKHPAKAFLAWCSSYTKNQKP